MKVNWIAECAQVGVNSGCITEWSSGESASFNFVNMLFYSVVQDDKGWLLCKGELASTASSSCIMKRFPTVDRALRQMVFEVMNAVRDLKNCIYY